MTKPRAMVLGAGYGTRLRPLTDELPKPLIPLGDRPLLAHVAERLAGAGFSSMVVNTHHLGTEFSKYSKGLTIKLELIHETRILGTAGGVRAARVLFGPPPVVVWNGDIVADPPLAQLSALVENGGLAVVVAAAESGNGTVGLDGAGNVVRLRGERFGTETAAADYVGICALGADVLGRLPEEGCLIGDVALPLLRGGGRIQTVTLRGPWRDVGSLAAYRAAGEAWLRERSLDSWVHPSARVASGVSLRSSIVGEGAIVEGEGELSSVVVWPGARAAAPLAGCVVTTAGRVVHFP